MSNPLKEITPELQKKIEEYKSQVEVGYRSGGSCGGGACGGGPGGACGGGACGGTVYRRREKNR